MIDHVTLRVTDLARAKAFYVAALAPIGYELLAEFEGFLGMGDGRPDLWITTADAIVNPMHLAFTGTRAQVDAFYAAAMAAGATDNGGPGPREHYSPTYYGAFVLDHDGNNIEVCCHVAPGKAKVAKKAAKAVKKAAKAVKKAAKAVKKAAPKAKATKKAAPKPKIQVKAKKKR